MKKETIKALSELAKAAAKSQGIDGNEIVMTVNSRAEEVPDYFYDIDDIDLPACAYGHDWIENFFDNGVVCEICGIKKSERQLHDETDD